MVKLINKQIVFKHNEESSHSYRIPSIIKKSNGELLIVVDQRIHSQLDAPYSKINQVYKISYDGLKFGSLKYLAKLDSKDDKFVSLIDSIIVEDDKKQVHIFVDLFPEQSGLMPIVESKNPLYEHQLITDDNSIILFDLVNESKLFLKQSNFEKKLWYVFDEKKNQVKNLSAMLIFNKQNNSLVFSLYKKDLSSNKQGWVFVQSLFENNSLLENNEKHQYAIPSGSYLCHFIMDQNNEITFFEFLNRFLDKKAYGKNALVFSPGKGLLLKNQNTQSENGKILIPLYESVYALPLKAYVAILDKEGKWTTSRYLNSLPENWLSETQLVESKNGLIYSFSRNKFKNCLSISVSKDSGKTWEGLNGEIQHQTKICLPQLNTQIMHGISYVKNSNDEFVFISLPALENRKNGKLFVVKNFNFENIKEIYQITNEDEPFGYSCLEVFSIDKSKIKLSILYETTFNLDGELSWVGFDKPENTQNQASSEISYQLLEIDLSKL